MKHTKLEEALSCNWILNLYKVCLGKRQVDDLVCLRASLLRLKEETDLLERTQRAERGLEN